MKRYIPFGLIVAVLAVAAGGGWLLYRAKQQPPPPPVAANRVVAPTPAPKTGAAPPHMWGRANAPVTLEEFGDFQCPPCARMAPTIKELEKNYGDRLRVIFRQFPLAVHVRALQAAYAAEAAGMQNHFWEMHDLLYDNQWVWTRVVDVRDFFVERAKSLGLDVERFEHDMDSDPVKIRIAADRDRATSLGVDRTPIIFVNGQRLAESSLNPAGVQAAIDAALNTKSK
jgi:NhaA family Na+:H+ antiporter